MFSSIPLQTPEPEFAERIESLLAEQSTRALIVVSCINGEENLDRVTRAASQAQVAVVSSGEPGEGIVSLRDVEADGYGIGYVVGSYLAERGHRDVGLVTWDPAVFPWLGRRMRGLRAALRDKWGGDAHLATGRCKINGDNRAAYNVAVRLLKRRPSVTALSVADDILAVAVMEAVKSRGYRIPEDISVIGCDNLSFCDKIFPELTSVDIGLRRMGKIAVSLLWGRETPPRVKPVVVPRNSVASARQVSLTAK